MLLLEFDIPELWQQLIHWSLKYQGVEFPKLLSFLPAEVQMWNDLPYTLFDTGMLVGFKDTVNCQLLPLVVFSSVLLVQMLVGLQKQFINYFGFPT